MSVEDIEILWILVEIEENTYKNGIFYMYMVFDVLGFLWSCVNLLALAF